MPPVSPKWYKILSFGNRSIATERLKQKQKKHYQLQYVTVHDCQVLSSSIFKFTHQLLLRPVLPAKSPALLGRLSAQKPEQKNAGHAGRSRHRSIPRLPTKIISGCGLCIK